jgi:hypothetical protein
MVLEVYWSLRKSNKSNSKERCLTDGLMKDSDACDCFLFTSDAQQKTSDDETSGFRAEPALREAVTAAKSRIAHHVGQQLSNPNVAGVT